MHPVLTPVQQRVWGVLIEKSLSQPAYYPMTLNAVNAACNQKQNRDPVMSLGEGEVAKALHELQEMGLVSLAPSSPGARANRFGHQAQSCLAWDRPQQAIMAELLVRGPQTLGELHTRAGRMSGTLQNLEIVSNILNDLATREPPMVVELEREPGKSTTRFAHLLCPEDRIPKATGDACPEQAPVTAAAPEWLERVQQLEHKLDRLTEKVARIEAKVTSRLP